MEIPTLIAILSEQGLDSNAFVDANGEIVTLSQLRLILPLLLEDDFSRRMLTPPASIESIAKSRVGIHMNDNVLECWLRALKSYAFDLAMRVVQKVKVEMDGLQKKLFIAAPKAKVGPSFGTREVLKQVPLVIDLTPSNKFKMRNINVPRPSLEQANCDGFTESTDENAPSDAKRPKTVGPTTSFGKNWSAMLEDKVTMDLYETTKKAGEDPKAVYYCLIQAWKKSCQTDFTRLSDFANSLEIGDIVEISYLLYSHFMIFVGKGQFMEFTRSGTVGFKSLCEVGTNTFCRINQNEPDIKIKVLEQYKERSSEDILKISKFYRDNEDGTNTYLYDINSRQCEFFCTEVKYGIPFSYQAMALDQSGIGSPGDFRTLLATYFSS